jgi:hypothetical protein
VRAGTWCARAVACCAILGIFQLALGDDDDDKNAGPSPQSAQPALNSEQQRAVGIVVAHPVAAKAPQTIEALALVLDATTLVSDLGEEAVAAAAEHSASAELARLHALYDGGAGASLKMLEAAQAEQAKPKAQQQLAASRFA